MHLKICREGDLKLNVLVLIKKKKEKKKDTEREEDGHRRWVTEFTLHFFPQDPQTRQ